MARYVCSICGYVHDESAAGELFSSLPDSWTCPVCGAAKSEFEAETPGPTSVASAPTQAQGDRSVRPATYRLTPLLAHRVFGYVFLAVYLLLILQMAPRLWTYQIEFPARTVVHLSLGMAVGVMLLLKIGIVRFFRRLDQTLVPLLGTSLLVSSAVLIGISVPSAFQEAFATARLFTEENRERVRALLEHSGLDDDDAARLATTPSLRAGQGILRRECVDCHDLRTVLARPRTPALWRQTVRRMADRTAMFNPLDDRQQWQVTAYLTALSPQLQKSVQQYTEQQQRSDAAAEAAAAITAADPLEVAYDAAAAEALYQAKCSQCHAVSVVASSPPDSEAAARQLVAAMVDEGLEATPQELAVIVQYLTQTFGK